MNLPGNGGAVRELASENDDNRSWTSTAAMFAPQKSKDDKKKSSKKSSGDSKGSSGSSGDKKSDPAASQPTSAWVLVLGTYSEAEHAQAARTMLDELRRIVPEVARQARVHTGSKGSMVVYGHYTGRDDKNAEEDQERLKKVQFQNRPLFNRVILTRIDTRTMDSQFHPHDLLAVRQKYPKVDPLYTVDVAMWDDFGEGKMAYDEIRKKAETYCAQLRSQGIESYFYHDDEAKRSMVTVGVFDRRAINETSRLFSPEVEAVMKKFPARLVNGEPLLEMKNKHRPSAGTKPQTPKLVLVPEL